MNTPFTIVMIGAGRVATHLAPALSACGYRILQVYSRTLEAARTLAEKTGSQATNRLEELSPEADLYLVSVSDTALTTLLPAVTSINPQALFVHTAGSVPMSIWEGLADRYGVLYPMQTFSKEREVDFHQVSFFIEARKASDTRLLKELASALSPKVYEATSEQRKYLHIGAVFACNFTNHMYAVCEELLGLHNLPFTAMLPLIDETARKVHELSPRLAQTGPASRQDQNILESHRQLLETEAPDLTEIYRLLSEHIQSYLPEK